LSVSRRKNNRKEGVSFEEFYAFDSSTITLFSETMKRRKPYPLRLPVNFRSSCALLMPQSHRGSIGECGFKRPLRELRVVRIRNCPAFDSFWLHVNQKFSCIFAKKIRQMQIKIFEFNMVFVNTYLLYDETKEAVIIDCGAFTEKECNRLKEYITSGKLKIKHVLNTHLHFDHVLGNRFIYLNYGLKPQYSEQEDRMPNLKIQAASFGLRIDYEPVRAENFINGDDYIHFGNTTLKALPTPGHSPGSLSFYCEKDHCVFTGDALFRHDIGRTDLWEGDKTTLIHAIRNHLLTLPENTVIFPGHGPTSTVMEEKQHNIYLRI
jgi:glyoxylase-like metal-dependent hydrolase (beta-lactamase superfamily II)